MGLRKVWKLGDKQVLGNISAGPIVSTGTMSGIADLSYPFMGQEKDISKPVAFQHQYFKHSLQV